jgi:hypothetical protein
MEQQTGVSGTESFRANTEVASAACRCCAEAVRDTDSRLSAEKAKVAASSTNQQGAASKLLND